MYWNRQWKWPDMVWHQLAIYSPPLAWGLVSSMSACACSSNQRVCNDSIAYDQLLVCPRLKSAEVRATLIVTPLMLIALNITVHHVAGMLIPMPANQFQGAKLTMYSLQLEHHRSEEPRGPGPVCLCCTPATSTSCRSKFCTWPFLGGDFFYGALSWLELMLALGTPMPEQQHTSDRPFCPTTILCGRWRGIFIWILSVDRLLYLSPAYHLK